MARSWRRAPFVAVAASVSLAWLLAPAAHGAGLAHLSHGHARARPSAAAPSDGAACAGASGRWCSGYWAQVPVPVRPPPLAGRPCPGNCSGIGTCFADTGACHCPAGGCAQARTRHQPARMELLDKAGAAPHERSMPTPRHAPAARVDRRTPGARRRRGGPPGVLRLATRGPIRAPQAGGARSAPTPTSGPARAVSAIRVEAARPTATLGPTCATSTGRRLKALTAGAHGLPAALQVRMRHLARHSVQAGAHAGRCRTRPSSGRAHTAHACCNGLHASPGAAPPPLPPRCAPSSRPPLHTRRRGRRCAGICDDDIAACYCDPKLGNPRYGRVPAPPGSPPGTPPLREGRPLFDPCNRLADDGRGGALDWRAHAKIPFADVYGPGGWCVADEPKVQGFWGGEGDRRAGRARRPSGRVEPAAASRQPAAQRQGSPALTETKSASYRHHPCSRLTQAPDPSQSPSPPHCRRTHRAVRALRMRPGWLRRPRLPRALRAGVPQPVLRPRRVPPRLLPLRRRLVGPRLCARRVPGHGRRASRASAALAARARG